MTTHIDHFSTIGECKYCQAVTTICGKCHACDDCHPESIVDQLVSLTPDESNAAFVNLKNSDNPKFRMLARILAGDIGMDEGFAKIQAMSEGTP